MTAAQSRRVLDERISTSMRQFNHLTGRHLAGTVGCVARWGRSVEQLLVVRACNVCPPLNRALVHGINMFE